MNLLILFITLNIANVIIQTIKSLATVKCGRIIAALVNALAYGLYTFVVIYMTIDSINIWVKAGIVAAANFLGVFVVKSVEKQLEKTKLWKIECAIPQSENIKHLAEKIEQEKIPCSYIFVGSWVIFNCYCKEKHQVNWLKEMCKLYNGKLSAYEAKDAL